MMWRDEIPWSGPSVIVPASAIEMLHKFNQNFNYVPIVQCRDCDHAEPEPPIDRRSRKAYQGGYWCEYWSEGIGAWCPANGFCHACKPRVIPCRNADEETAHFADAPTLKPASEPPKTRVLEFGA